jgi:hypothetical protein
MVIRHTVEEAKELMQLPPLELIEAGPASELAPHAG